MRRLLALVGVTALATVGLGAAAGPASAATSCTGTISGATI